MLKSGQRASSTGRLAPGITASALIVAGFIGFAIPVAGVHADGRKYTFTYESLTMPKGAWEYEQWITRATDKDSDEDFDRIDFRHELEFGVTDRFQLALYLSDWRFESSNSVDDRVEWKNFAIEGIYNLSNPIEDPIGSALYGELKFGDELLEIEGKAILEKYFGLANVAYNATLAAEWEGSSFDEDKGEFAQSLGVSHEVLPVLSLGAELIHEIEFDDWDEVGDSVVYLGPNFGLRKDKLWITVTPVYQLTDVEDEPNFQVRTIFGLTF